MARTAVTCHTASGLRFRVFSQRRYVAIYEYDADSGRKNLVSIEYRTDDLRKARDYAMKTRGIQVIDTGTDKIVYPLSVQGLR